MRFHVQPMDGVPGLKRSFHQWVIGHESDEIHSLHQPMKEPQPESYSVTKLRGLGGRRFHTADPDGRRSPGQRACSMDWFGE
jgi:hypothetical protein